MIESAVLPDPTCDYDRKMTIAGSIKWQYADEKSVTYAEPPQPCWNHNQAAGTNWKDNAAEVEKMRSVAP